MSYVCPKCGKELKLKKSLKSHLAANNCCKTEWPCPKCGKVFETRLQLNGHKSSTAYRGKKRGPYKGQKEYSKDKRKSNLTCPYCFKKFEKGNQKSNHVSNCKLNPKYEQNLATRQAAQVKRWKGKHHTEATKEKIRKARFKYLKKLNGKAAGSWKRRQQGKMSYPEAWFYDNAIIKHNLLEKHDIVNEYPEYPYFIDFAFLNVKLAVELDGKQHFHDSKRVKHDIARDELLTSKGWKMFRILHDELTEEKIQEVLAVLNNVQDYKPKQLVERLLRFSEYKPKPQKRTLKEYHQQQREKYLQSQTEKIELVKSSNINFSKFGWSGQVAKLLDIQHPRVARWVRRFCPDIWSSAFHRKRH